MRASLRVVLALCWATPALAQEAHKPEPELEPEPEPEPDEEYGEAGSFELGGSIGAQFTDDLITLTASPSFGYFVRDHLELSALLHVSYTRVEHDAGGHSSTTTVELLAEPSYHRPVNKHLQVLLGLGLGGGYDGDHPYFEIAPRIGLNILTARSNVITPAITVPIRIGESFGDDGSTGADVALELEVGITTTW